MVHYLPYHPFANVFSSLEYSGPATLHLVSLKLSAVRPYVYRPPIEQANVLIIDFWGYFEPIREHMPANCSADVQRVVGML